MSVAEAQARGHAETTRALSGIIREPSYADRHPVQYNRRRKIIETSLGILVPLALLSLWQLGSSSGWWDKRIFPSPWTSLETLWKMFDKRSFHKDILATFYRIAWGFFWGAGLGLIFGFVMGLSRTVRAALEPMFNALYTVPKIALLSVFLIAFGFGEKPVIILLAVTIFFFAWVPTQAAVMTVPESFREAADSFEANRWQLFRHVILPAVLPTIFVTLRVAVSVCVLAVIGVEFAFTPSGNKGLGYVINQARNNVEPKTAFAGIFVAALLGVFAASLIRVIGRMVVPWQKEDNTRAGI